MDRSAAIKRKRFERIINEQSVENVEVLLKNYSADESKQEVLQLNKNWRRRLNNKVQSNRDSVEETLIVSSLRQIN